MRRSLTSEFEEDVSDLLSSALLSVLSSDLLSILLSALLSEPFSFKEETEDVVPPALSTLLVVPEELLLQAAAERAKLMQEIKPQFSFS